MPVPPLCPAAFPRGAGAGGLRQGLAHPVPARPIRRSMEGAALTPPDTHRLHALSPAGCLPRDRDGQRGPQLRAAPLPSPALGGRAGRDAAGKAQWVCGCWHPDPPPPPASRSPPPGSHRVAGGWCRAGGTWGVDGWASGHAEAGARLGAPRGGRPPAPLGAARGPCRPERNVCAPAPRGTRLAASAAATRAAATGRQECGTGAPAEAGMAQGRRRAARAGP